MKISKLSAEDSHVMAASPPLHTAPKGEDHSCLACV